MGVRAVASVVVTFGMVSVPVKLYVATSDANSVAFNLLHRDCGSRLKQQYVCQHDGAIVELADRIKGYEFSKDQYVTFTPEELTALEEEGSKTVAIAEFVPSETVSALYYDKAYYLAPDKGGAKPYALLAESMRRSGQTAIGRYAARGKQYIIQLRAVDGGIVMQQLRYAPEVRSIADVGVDKAEVSEAELALAEQLIAAISSPAFDANRYEDAVAKRFQDAIAQKVQGNAVSVSPATETPSKVIDLMDALKASLAAAPKPAKTVKKLPVTKKRKAA